MDNTATKKSFYKTWSVKIVKKKRQKIKQKEMKEKEKQDYLQEKCIFCNSRTINTAIVHGKSSHKVSCYVCARKHWKYSARCPMCRRKISAIHKI